MRATRVFFIALAVLSGAAHSAGGPPHLASLQIELWPEYDRPQVLVILKGELPKNITLPAQVSLHLPASSGGPTAVAYADPSGTLKSLAYSDKRSGDSVEVRLSTPQRSFHIEFYDPLDEGRPQREYRYAWPGGFAIDELTVLVKEPVSASALRVQPDLPETGASPDGTSYHAASLGALSLGQRLPIVLSYTKADPRTSAEILTAPEARPRAELWRDPWLVAAILLALASGSGAAFVAWRRRSQKGG